LDKRLGKYGLKLNPKKTKFFTVKRGYKICGVTIGGASPTISRKEINKLRAQINNFIVRCIKNTLIDEEKKQEKKEIIGRISFVASIDSIKASSLYMYTKRRVSKLINSLPSKHSIKDLKQVEDELLQFTMRIRKANKKRLDSLVFSKERELRRKIYSTK